MGLIETVRSWFTPTPVERAVTWPFAPGEFANIMGRLYPLSGMNQTLAGDAEEPPTDFAGIVTACYQRNPIVMACVDARVSLFSQARFQFRNRTTSKLYGSPALGRLERPWPGGTTADMLSRMELYDNLAGEAFIGDVGNRLAIPRPDWVTVLVGGDVRDIGAPVIGYAYWPGGRYGGQEPVPFDVSEMAHFAPMPDPLSPHRGQSWIRSVIPEILADSAMTTHKSRYLTNGATVNLVVEVDADGEKWKEYVARFKASHQGTDNAYNTLFTNPKMKITPVGSTLEQMTFKDVQAAGEVRIAAASGVPAVVAGISQGLEGSSLNAGNFAASMRRFAEIKVWPLWTNAAGSMAHLVNVPGDSELWIDVDHIPAMHESQHDAAQVQAAQAQAVRQYVDAGFVPDSVVAAINAHDLTKLKHSGLFSVQLQPPTPDQPEPEPPVGVPPEPAAEEPDDE